MTAHRVHQLILRSHHLFEPLDDQQLDELVETSQLLNFDKGDPIFNQGEPADAFYFVLTGTIKIYRLTPGGQEKVIEVIGERQSFAEAMMFMDSPTYVASSQAVVPTQLYRFPKTTYMSLLRRNEHLPFALLAKLSMRLHQRLNEIETLSLKNAIHRVVRYLMTQLAHSSDNRVELSTAKHLVAAQLSIQPETFSRILRRLLDEGVVEQDGKHLRVLDPTRLEQFE